MEKRNREIHQDVPKNVVVDYYNLNTQFKINDFATVSPRIESAWITLKKNIPIKPKRILEVGCGVGSICFRMKKYWPESEVYGMDISTESIEMAIRLFCKPGLHFTSGILTQDTYQEGFDLIVFMDVYEHISLQDRNEVHLSLQKLLNNKGRIFLSVPTPHNLIWSQIYKPETMQPVDEHISYEVIGKLAQDTGSEVQLYQIKNVWNVGDYAHILLEKNDDFESAFFKSKPVTSLERGIRIVNKIKNRLRKPFRLLWIRLKLRGLKPKL